MGVLAQAIAGALAGTGKGLEENAKQGFLQDNMRLKAQTDTDREVMLQNLRSQAAKDLQASSQDFERPFRQGALDVAQGTLAETGRHNVAAEDVQRTALAETSRHNAADESLRSQSIAVQRELSKNALQVADDGTVYRIGSDNTAEAIALPDGSPLKVAKNLDAASAAKIATLTKLIDAKETALKNVFDPVEKRRAQAAIDNLYGQLGQVSGLNLNPGASASTRLPGDKRPPLSQFDPAPTPAPSPQSAASRLADQQRAGREAAARKMGVPVEALEVARDSPQVESDPMAAQLNVETRELELGKRFDYSPEVKRWIAAQDAAKAKEQADYFKAEQTRMLRRPW